MACEFWDLPCQLAKQATTSVFDTVAPFILPAILFILALFLFPKIGKNGWILSVITIGGLLWYYFFGGAQFISGLI